VLTALAAAAKRSAAASSAGASVPSRTASLAAGTGRARVRALGSIRLSSAMGEACAGSAAALRSVPHASNPFRFGVIICLITTNLAVRRAGRRKPPEWRTDLRQIGA